MIFIVFCASINNMNGTTVTLPKRLLKDLLQATEYFDKIQSELEDFVLSSDAKFLAKMRKARREHTKGEFSDWLRIKAKYGL